MSRVQLYRELSLYLLCLTAVLIFTLLLRGHRELGERESLLLSLQNWATQSEYFEESDQIAVRLLEEKILRPYRLRIYQLIPCETLCEEGENCESVCQQRGQEVSSSPEGSLLLFEIFRRGTREVTRLPFSNDVRLSYRSWPPREFIVLRAQPRAGEYRFHFIDQDGFQPIGSLDTGVFDEVRFEDLDGDGQPELIAPDPTFAHPPHLYHVEMTFRISSGGITPAPQLRQLDPPEPSQVRVWLQESKQSAEPLRHLLHQALTLAHHGYQREADQLIDFAYPDRNDYVLERWTRLKSRLATSPFYSLSHPP